MTISAAAVASDFGVNFERNGALKSFARFVVIFWRIGMGRWYNTSQKHWAISLLIRFIISVLLLWGPLYFAFFYRTDRYDFENSHNSALIHVPIFAIAIYFIIWLFVLLTYSFPHAFNQSFLNTVNHFFATNVFMRTLMHVCDIRAENMKYWYLSDGGHYENLGVYVNFQRFLL